MRSLLSKALLAAIATGAWAVAFHSAAQEILKHPRVVELEDSLKDSATAYVSARFPEVPFMVTVKVDPLRRDVGGREYVDNEGLPFFDPVSEEEIRDEWDNPQVPLKALINRVRRISLTIQLPTKIRETEVTELKEGIFNSLHLTPARDTVEVQRKDWATEEVPWIAIYVASAILSALLVGLLIINRSSANRIARALGDLKSQSAASNAPPPPPPMNLGDMEPKSSRRRESQELKFADPIKLKELASKSIEILARDPAFPNHHDIFMLDKFGMENPEKLGAILGEFPAETQEKLFSYSADNHWIEALNEPAFLDFECLEVFQALTQNLRAETEVEWYHTVLAVWRLNEDRAQFLKGLPKDEAFALLVEMPKSIAVSEARKAFPGAWASILDPDFRPKRPSRETAHRVREAAIQIRPLNSIEMVARYKSEHELLEYLRIADPTAERDIYGAAPAGSLIHGMRPPFFVVFDQTPEILQWFVSGVPTDQWALALFNVPKSERSKVDAHLSEKQRFLLVERFKKFDTQPPDRQTVGAAREAIGRAFKKFMADQGVADQTNAMIDSTEDMGNGGGSSAA